MQRHFRFIPDDDIVNRTRWYINFRWLYLFMLSAPLVLTVYLSRGWSEQLKIALTVAAAALATNVVFLIFSRILNSKSQSHILAVFMILADIAIVTGITVIGGGIESRRVILYVVPIIMSAAMLGRKGIYGSTALSVTSTTAIFIYYYLTELRPGGSLDGVPFYKQFPEAVYNIVFAATALIAVMIAMDYIIRLLRQKERQALRTVEDLKRAQAIGRFGSWDVDVPSNTLTCSDEVYHIIGIARSDGELTIDRYMTFVHPKDRRLIKTVVRRASAKPVRFSFDYRIITADGDLRYVHAEGESATDRSGSVRSIIGTVRDTTEERMLDESKNEFVSLASHQLRTPATVVKQYLGMLLDGYAGELTGKQRLYLKTASDTNERQIAIVNNLLDVAQLESGKIHLTLVKVDLVALTAELIQEFKPRAESKQQTLRLVSRHKHLYGLADSYHLRAVLENIIDNALRYTTINKPVTIHITKESNMAVISVTDRGVGIAPENLSKLFKKFSRIEHPSTFQEEGAGLGLYWSMKVMALHGGKIEVKSVFGKGSTFKVILPLSTKPGRAKKSRRNLVKKS